MKILRVDNPVDVTPVSTSIMADSCVRPDRRPLFLPDGQWTCEIRRAIKISRLGKNINTNFAHRYYDQQAIVNLLRPANQLSVNPDSIDDAVVTGSWIDSNRFPSEFTFDDRKYVLNLHTTYIDRLIEQLSINTTFKTGDLIILPEVFFSFIPTVDRNIKVYADNDKTVLLDFTIK